MFSKKLLEILILILISLSFNSYAAIFLDSHGHDPRQPVEFENYPWSTLGRLERYTKSGELDAHCTATLIAPDLAITAAHCAFDEYGNKTPMRFYLGYKNGHYKKSAKIIDVVYGTNRPDRDWSLDWAIIFLDKKIGCTDNWMDLNSINLDQNNLPISVRAAGYSIDLSHGKIASQSECNLMEQRFDFLYGTNCSGDAGGSGGPIFQYNQKSKKALLNAIFIRGISGGAKFKNYCYDNASLVLPIDEQIINIVQNLKIDFSCPIQ